ncbi:hypothetical protein ID866_752 [Astraeus odoratus]|nr:hypothetical protein ID866_752 [Astraeus odoratus]
MTSQSSPVAVCSSSPAPRTIRGTKPGLLDPSQKSRLLRFPDSELLFASFDPKTAFVDHIEPDIRKLNINDGLLPPKRVVIEATPKGACFWRFVPRARLEDGVQDEGLWPRLIDICGEHIYCHQEQWEIYKLDPAYKCVVHSGGKLSSVMGVATYVHSTSATEPPGSKRRRNTSPETNEPAQCKRARSHHTPTADSTSDSSETNESSEEDEVEEMIVDEELTKGARGRPSDRKPDRPGRDKMQADRQWRWERNRKAQEKYHQEPAMPTEASFSMRIDPPENSAADRISPTHDHIKRKGSSSAASDDDSDAKEPSNRPTGQGTRSSKRVRTDSPEGARHTMNYRKILRERKQFEKAAKFRQRCQPNRDPISMVRSPFDFVPPVEGNDDEDEDGGAAPAADSQQKQRVAEDGNDPEAARQAEISESIRKMRELERDKPLWDEQRRKREARELAEEKERQAKAERRRQEEEQRKMREQEEAERARRRTQAQAEERAREEERRHQENYKRRQRQRWESGPWTPARALERYKMLSEAFDAQKFTSGVQITFHDIPWPVLHAPSRLTVEDVDWAAVEAFFDAVKVQMRVQDYKDFVQKSHRRFHPDRWQARNVWAAVVDEVERNFMEIAANTVAQAITPIWRNMKDI